MNRMIVVAALAALLASGASFAQNGGSSPKKEMTPAVQKHTTKAKHKIHHHKKAKHHIHTAQAAKGKHHTASKKKEPSSGDSDK